MLWKCLVITPFGWLSREYCLHLVTLGFVTIIRHKCFQVFYSVQRMLNSFCIDFKVSIATLLKNPSRLSRDVQEQSIWSSRLPQEMWRRSLGKSHTSSWDSISSNNLLVRRICCFHRWFLWEISGPKKEGWWHRFWMRLNPILMV